MLTPSTSYNYSLGNNLTLRSIQNAEEVERLAEFNGRSFSPAEADMTRALVYAHPDTRSEHWLYIQNDLDHQIVSSLCLIPWMLRYEDVALKSGEMGIVSTDPAYRNRGLIRKLDLRFKELLHEGDFDLSHIQGIPYFYRQFGYEYAIPLEPQWQIELRHVPEANPAAYGFRRALADDIPQLMALYDDTTRGLAISTLRSADVWRFMLENTSGTGIESEVWLMLERDKVVGYCRISKHGFGSGLIVSETSRLQHPRAKAMLYWLKQIAEERDKPYIRFNLPEANDLVRYGAGYGARDAGTYAFQMYIPSPARLLQKIAPVLTRRVAESPFAGLDEIVHINLYRDTLALHFDHGVLHRVESIGQSDNGSIRLPPNLLPLLVLGYRSRQELSYMFPDVSMWGDGKLLTDVLFPRMSSFMYSVY